MSDLIQGVKDGKIQETKSSAKETQSKAGGELGKDAFMQLLVTQMQYQDPLNPSDNTQYVSQLATFSQLEKMENIAQTTTNSQAFSLVGKKVIIKLDRTSNSASNLITGKVDFVYVTGSKTKLSIGGKLYSFDQLDTVLDDNYVETQNNSATTGGSTSNPTGGTTTGGSTSNPAGGTTTGGSTSNPTGGATTGGTTTGESTGNSAGGTTTGESTGNSAGGTTTGNSTSNSTGDNQSK